jgi:hypothetical protein
VKDDVLALIDVYATGMEIAMWAWSAVFLAAHLALAWLFLATGRNAWRRIAASYTRTHHTVAAAERDQQRIAAAFTDTRKETQP